MIRSMPSFPKKRMRKNHTTSGRPKKLKRDSKNGGRRKACVESASKKTLRRRASDLMELAENNSELLELSLKLNKQGNGETTDEIVKPNDQLPHSKETALALFLECDLTKNAYAAIVKDSRSRNSFIYPSYRSIRQAKLECLPANYIVVSEVEIAVSMQSMLNKSAERLCEAVASDWDQEHLDNLALTVTVGFDSSSGHTNAHQKCENSANDSSNSQQSLLVTNMLIAKLGCKLHGEV